MDVAEKVVVVTGGGSGLGAVVAHVLRLATDECAAGRVVTLVDRDTPPLTS